jgi:hypothetical protein
MAAEHTNATSHGERVDKCMFLCDTPRQSINPSIHSSFFIINQSLLFRNGKQQKPEDREKENSRQLLGKEVNSQKKVGRKKRR